MQRRSQIGSTVLFALLFLIACQAPSGLVPEPASLARVTVESQLATPSALVSMLPTPTPFIFSDDLENIEVEPGKAVVIGRLLSSTTSQPITNTPVRLAEVYYADETRDPDTAAWALNNAASPFAYTDESGMFIFENVEARDYVIFVGDIMETYTLDVRENGFPRTYSFAPDVVTELGDISVDY